MAGKGWKWLAQELSSLAAQQLSSSAAQKPIIPAPQQLIRKKTSAASSSSAAQQPSSLAAQLKENSYRSSAPEQNTNRGQILSHLNSYPPTLFLPYFFCPVKLDVHCLTGFCVNALWACLWSSPAYIQTLVTTFKFFKILSLKSFSFFNNQLCGCYTVFKRKIF